MDTVWKMAANIFRERKKPESIKRGEKLDVLLRQKQNRTKNTTWCIYETFYTE